MRKKPLAFSSRLGTNKAFCISILIIICYTDYIFLFLPNLFPRDEYKGNQSIQHGTNSTV
uniref:Uncharacterized protein n=1 Tax=Octopus bimaculoides TaxID=37653 RepID=A0A0L8HTN5_OCTBM